MSYVSRRAALIEEPCTEGALLPDKTRVDGFREFVEAHERKLRHALTAALGYDLGKDAAAEALAYGSQTMVDSIQVEP